MPDQLSDLLHRSVDDAPVPHPAAYDILTAGQGLRRRRRVATGLAVTVAVVAAGVGGALVVDVAGTTESRDFDIADHGKVSDAAAQQAYDTWGAWAAEGTVTIGETVVDLPGVTNLAQTSAGVVAQTDDQQGGASFVLVRPDGSTEKLSIPADVQHVDGDLNATRVAWLDPGAASVEVHVWDVAADREVGSISQPVQGDGPDSNGQFIAVAKLDGDHVYFGAGNDITFRVNWRAGAVAAIDHLPLSVHHDLATTQDGDGWVIRDMASDRVVRRLEGDLLNPSLSPDGTRVLVVDIAGATPVAAIETIAGERSMDLAEVETIAVWTRAGNVLSLVEGGVQLCASDGSCEGKSVEAPGGFVLLADFLNVG
ncbi:hypothetical protein [Nocardioides sp. GCM10030258]|uniref:hypothetical protein n=1 Tax=unclassified Nocardioides TaxID=2615069 RepID=UPI0036158DE3